jgi:osmotically-inducible protein OsmY
MSNGVTLQGPVEKQEPSGQAERNARDTMGAVRVIDLIKVGEIQ